MRFVFSVVFCIPACSHAGVDVLPWMQSPRASWLSDPIECLIGYSHGRSLSGARGGLSHYEPTDWQVINVLNIVIMVKERTFFLLVFVYRVRALSPAKPL